MPAVGEAVSRYTVAAILPVVVFLPCPGTGHKPSWCIASDQSPGRGSGVCLPRTPVDVVIAEAHFPNSTSGVSRGKGERYICRCAVSSSGIDCYAAARRWGGVEDYCSRGSRRVCGVVLELRVHCLRAVAGVRVQAAVVEYVCHALQLVLSLLKRIAANGLPVSVAESVRVTLADVV